MKKFFSKHLFGSASKNEPTPTLGQALLRRDVFRGSAFGLFASLLPSKAVAAPTSGLQLGTSIYQSIGVKPLINARGTFTIISGSTMLPEVRMAMTEASQT